MLTGNHAVKRDRAQSDTEALNSMIRSENRLGRASPYGKGASAPAKAEGGDKKWAVKSNQLEMLQEEYVAYRKKSHAV